jgi:hypothetical protein
LRCCDAANSGIELEFERFIGCDSA